MAEDQFKIRIDGDEYTLDDFEGRDLVNVERQLDISLGRELERMSSTGVYALVYLVKHKKDPGVTIDDVLSMNMGEISKSVGDSDEDDAKKDPTPPPVPARKKSTAA
jgi:hypothetical protein